MQSGLDLEGIRHCPASLKFGGTAKFDPESGGCRQPLLPCLLRAGCHLPLPLQDFLQQKSTRSFLGAGSLVSCTEGQNAAHRVLPQL